MRPPSKTRLAVWKLTSCDGCQLQLLNLEEELAVLSQKIAFAHFPEGFRDGMRGRVDLSLVEGSVTTPHDAQQVQRIRRRSRIVVAMGACATAGGIQALRNFGDLRAWLGLVYPRPAIVESLPRSTPLSDHIPVDLELKGCPIDPRQLLTVVLAVHRGRIPRLPTGPLCMECKRAGHVCVTVAGGISCMGPVTQAGCGAVCPGVGRGCYGCFGPGDTANTRALRRLWRQVAGMPPAEIRRAFRGVNAWAPPYREESERT